MDAGIGLRHPRCGEKRAEVRRLAQVLALFLCDSGQVLAFSKAQFPHSSKAGEGGSSHLSEHAFSGIPASLGWAEAAVASSNLSIEEKLKPGKSAEILKCCILYLFVS